MSDLPKRLRIKASMIALGERIAWGSDTALMEEAADVIEALSERDKPRDLLTAQPQASAAQSAPAGAVPEGYRWYLVPKEDTDAFNAACSAANDAYLGGVGPCGVFIAGYRALLAAAPAQPAAQDQVDQQEGLHVWRATSRLGYTCHFGEASAARAWAGENGTIERVDLTPVPDLQVVKRQDQGEAQRLREALEAIADCTDDDQARNCALIALSASTGQEVEP